MSPEEVKQPQQNVFTAARHVDVLDSNPVVGTEVGEGLLEMVQIYGAAGLLVGAFWLLREITQNWKP